MLDEVEECRWGGVEAMGSVDTGVWSEVEKFESMVVINMGGLQIRELRGMVIRLRELRWWEKEAYCSSDV